MVFRLQKKVFQFLSSPNGPKSANFGHFESLNADFDRLVSIFYILVQPNLKEKFVELVKAIFRLHKMVGP